MILFSVLLAVLSPGHAASAAKPPIVTRGEWGSKPHPIPDERRQVPAWVTLHHAGVPWRRTQDPAEFVRNMQDWGQNRPTRERPPNNSYWPDLPYHYLIAPDGRIFEGRPVEYEPESNTNYPLKGNIGVEMMGDFDAQEPTRAQVRSAVLIAAWLVQEHRLDPARVRGHRDAAPGQTGCPGKNFHPLLTSGRFGVWVNEALMGREPAIPREIGR